MGNRKIVEALAKQAPSDCKLRTYGYPIKEFCSELHIGHAKVIALIENGYLDVTTVDGEIVIVSAKGRAVARDFMLPEDNRRLSSR